MSDLGDLIDGAFTVGGAMRWVPPERSRSWTDRDALTERPPVKRVAVRAWLVAYLRHQRALRRRRAVILTALTRHNTGRRR